MAAEILCPDCGGVVGATEVTDGIGWPCTCGVGGGGGGNGSPDDTDLDMPAISGGTATTTATTTATPRVDRPPKPCVSCGRDTNGHRRFKDSRGYVCFACAKAEQQKARADAFKCEGCGRWMPLHSRHDYLGTTVCPTCLAERRDADRKRPRKLDTSAHVAHERRNLYVLLSIMGVLLLIVILRQTGVL
ncbi:MAG TPA: hypothetical protein VK324_07290 [Tepidisphaeraceae bacterium]|nr:hypothetical protein [Tepidisphaeraceae bacterium]